MFEYFLNQFTTPAGPGNWVCGNKNNKKYLADQTKEEIEAEQQYLAYLKRTPAYLNAVNELTQIALLERYKIEGVPDTCSERLVLQSLLFNAWVFFSDKIVKGELMALPCLPSTGMTTYGDYAKFNIYAPNGSITKCMRGLVPDGGNSYKLIGLGNDGDFVGDEFEGIAVRENIMQYPFFQYVDYYAMKIADCMESLDCVREGLKASNIIVSDKASLPSVNAWLAKRRRNKIASITAKDLTDITKKVVTLPLQTQNTLRDGTMSVEWYKNQFLNLCNIEASTMVDKKAQVSEDEVHMNSGNIKSNRFLDYLNSQLDLVNKYYGTNMKAVPVEHGTTITQKEDSEDNQFSDNSNEVNPNE